MMIQLLNNYEKNVCRYCFIEMLLPSDDEAAVVQDYPLPHSLPVVFVLCTL